jgi:hypothetical protein
MVTALPTTQEVSFMHRLFLLLLTINLTFSLDTCISKAVAQPNGQSEANGLSDIEELGEAKSDGVPTKPTESASSSLKVSTISSNESSQDKLKENLYLRQIQRIESQVNELKEEIFRSRTRLAILKESVLASGLSGTELKILHRNEMGANFKLERILYLLDGSPIRQAVDQNGELDQQEEIEILNGPIAPGNHTLQVELVYRGNGFGVFSYLQSYRFTLNDVNTFRAEEGKRITIAVVGYERNGITLELKDRPDIRFERTLHDLDKIEAKEGLKKSSKPNSNENMSAP